MQEEEEITYGVCRGCVPESTGVDGGKLEQRTGIGVGLVAREHLEGSLSHERRLRVTSRRLNSL